MRRSRWLAVGLAALSLAFLVRSASAEKIQASVLYRQNSDVTYRAFVPGYSAANAEITGACRLDPDPANCPGTGQIGTANGDVNYVLVGATLSLGLPDGRIAVVNCVNSFSAKGNYKRYCGMPMVERVEAEFYGQNARLTWRVGSDGQKSASETYRVVALLAKPAERATVSTDEGPGF